MSDTKPYPDEDEISLVDLVAVLVRYRRMIVGGTILTAVIAAAILFGLPMLVNTNGHTHTYTVERQFLVASIPEDLEDAVPMSPATRVQTAFRNPRLVGSAYALIEDRIATGPPEERTPAEYNTMIQDDVIGQDYTVTYNQQTRVVALKFSAPEEELARIFLDALVELVEEDLRSQLLPLIDTALSSTNARLVDTRAALMQMIQDAITRDGTGTATITTDSLTRYLSRTVTEVFGTELAKRDQLERLRQSASFLRETGEPLVMVRPVARGRAVRVVVSTMAALFLLVFIAFIRQYTRTVQSDPVEMEKLRTAWERR